MAMRGAPMVAACSAKEATEVFETTRETYHAVAATTRTDSAASNGRRSRCSLGWTMSDGGRHRQRGHVRLVLLGRAEDHGVVGAFGAGDGQPRALAQHLLVDVADGGLGREGRPPVGRLEAAARGEGVEAGGRMARDHHLLGDVDDGARSVEGDVAVDGGVGVEDVDDTVISLELRGDAGEVAVLQDGIDVVEDDLAGAGRAIGPEDLERAARGLGLAAGVAAEDHFGGRAPGGGPRPAWGAGAGPPGGGPPASVASRCARSRWLATNSRRSKQPAAANGATIAASRLCPPSTGSRYLGSVAPSRR